MHVFKLGPPRDLEVEYESWLLMAYIGISSSL